MKMSPQEETAALHPLEEKILKALKVIGKTVTTKELAELAGIDEISATRRSYWLAEKGLVKLREETKSSFEPTETGREIIEKGLPERHLLDFFKSKVLEQIDINALDIPDRQVALGQAAKQGLMAIKNGVASLTELGKKCLSKRTQIEELIFEGKHLTSRNESLPEKEVVRRGIYRCSTKKLFLVEITEAGIQAIEESKGNLIGELTPQIIVNKSWKSASFRPYNVQDEVAVPVYGRLHPLTITIERVRNAFLRMGFTEARGGFVESSFWCFDALFQPQDHPARDMADTFFMKEPARARLPGDKLVKRVARAHETGVCGSTGWGYPWSRDVAGMPVLRTHTTAVSARSLKGAKPPLKIFSVDKAFRNETLDYKHLMELHQVEGIVFEENVNFRHLLGYLKEFLNIMGFEKVRFRPGYFPYTEMSVEPEVFVSEKNEWMELGGSGIFRPEVVEPLTGIDAPVLAWGLGLERLAMLTYDIKDIRQLYTNEFSWLRGVNRRWNP